MTFLFVFLIEELNRIKYRRSILHIFSIVILFTSLKKQIIAIVILLKIIMRPSRGLFFALAGLILISIAPFVWRTVAPSSAEFLERRASSFLSERFLKPNPYGNMRLYLVVEYAPTVLTKNWLFGYGLERYGSYSALGSGRDIERSVLGMDDFISRDFNSTSRFGSVSADVGLLTIWMQMGVSGLLLYAFLVRSVCRNTLGFLKTVLISLPFMAGGAAISSVGFIFLISTISAFLDLKVGKRA